VVSLARSRLSSGGAALCLVTLLGGAARGEECGAIAGGGAALAEIDATARLAFVRDRLKDEARRTRVWSWTWGSLYTTAAALQLGLTPLRAPDTRVDGYVGGAGAAFGVAVLLVAPKKVLADERWLAARLARPGLGVCAQLAEAERLLVRDAADQAFGKTVFIHGGSFLFNVGLGLILATGFGHLDAGAIAATTGIAIGELQILSQPAGLVADLKRYRAGDLRAVRQRWPVWAVLPRLGASGAMGVTLATGW
jgi:hypothetical protein